MHSKKLLSLALSLFVVESVVGSPCKPRTSSDTSVASSTLAESTTAILAVPSTTDTTVAVVEASTTTETSETAAETNTAAVESTTTGPETTATTEAVTTTGETTTAEAQTTTTADAETTTTTEATTTTAADPGCAQTLLLTNPTPIFDAQNGRYDDSYNIVNPPFPIGVFGAASRNVFVSTNGFLSLDSGASHYANYQLPAELLPSTSIMPYWDDFLITEGTCNTGIFYDVYETARGNTFTIEYNVGSLRPSFIGTGEHFSVSFYEDHPGLVRFEYYQTTIHGSSATVGLQSGDLFSQFSFNQDNSIPDQYFIEIETNEEGSTTRTGSL